MLHLELWISNQSQVGSDHDVTADHLHAAGADIVMRDHPSVALDGQEIFGDDAERVWSAYRALADVVFRAGWGLGEVEEAELAAPELAAAIEGDEGASRNLQFLMSPNCSTWSDFIRQLGPE